MSMESDSTKMEKDQLSDLEVDGRSELNAAPNETGAMYIFRKHRERRIPSPLVATLADPFGDPISPVSSTDQGSNMDATFEPSIDMMVNDFDDEQTLNEEEALAAMESQDPQDEIATLQKESEMPIEELLAKYSEIPPPLSSHIKSTVKRIRPADSNKHKSKKNFKMKTNGMANLDTTKDDNCVQNKPIADIIVIDSGDEEEDNNRVTTTAAISVDNAIDMGKGDTNSNADANDVSLMKALDKSRQRRTHLMDLYPENYANSCSNNKESSLETLYGEEDEEYENEEHNIDYVRKTIMVGSTYQAVIPMGLSKYGDVLPYENEDKLIWEPSQVSEKEVEDYLIKTREIKDIPSGNDVGDEASIEKDEDDDMDTRAATPLPENIDNDEKPNGIIDQEPCNVAAMTEEVTNSIVVATDSELTRVVKDNEQALHLLVQCGYDFKEALRRRRLNAVPLTTDTMSIWSEEECRKFEEGIQKFGKDFLKIRQHQVRTRSMRELVQFYYLWKKSERRDHEFADSDTVDHMDMYLNEGDYGSNPVATANIHAINASNTSSSQTGSGGGGGGGNNKKRFTCAPKNFSIMTGNCMVVSGSSSKA